MPVSERPIPMREEEAMTDSATGVLLRGLALDGAVKFIVADTTGIARGLQSAHDAGPLGAMALGRASTAALMLAAGLKDKQQLGIQINGDGPLGEIYVIADPNGYVRATVHDPKADTGDLDLPSGIGMGRLTVIRRLDENAPAYRGVVPLTNGGVGADIAEYLLSSEQVASAVSVGERMGPDGVVNAGGFLVQALPDADPAVLQTLIDRIGRLPPIGDLLAGGLDLEGVLDRLFDAPQVLARTDLSLVCPCDREHFARKLCILGSEELASLTAELPEVVVECHFCRTRYIFDREQMNALLYGARMYEQAN